MPNTVFRRMIYLFDKLKNKGYENEISSHALRMEVARYMGIKKETFQNVLRLATFFGILDEAGTSVYRINWDKFDSIKREEGI